MRRSLDQLARTQLNPTRGAVSARVLRRKDAIALLLVVFCGLLASSSASASPSSAAWLDEPASTTTNAIDTKELAGNPIPAASAASVDASLEPGASLRTSASGVVAIESAADSAAAVDLHPMIPLPPAVWVGFAGLAYIARRVVRSQPD